MAFSLLLAFALSLSPALPSSDDRVEEWSEDLMVLVEKAEELHPDLHRSVSEEEFYAAVDELFERIPDLTDDQVVAEFMRLVAMTARDGRDGHSGVSAFRTFSYLPVRVYRFSDGWFVTESTDDDALIGARLEAIGGVPVDEVCARMAPLLNRDNDIDLKGRLAARLVQPELLHAIGITPERERTTLRLTLQDGSTREVTLEGRGFAARGHGRSFSSWWGPRLPADPEVRWLTHHEGPWNHEVIGDASTLYVRYDSVYAQEDSGRTLREFVAEFMGVAEETGVERIVIDVRSNGGGDNTTFYPLLEALQESRWNERGRLFLLTGRATFSAAGNFVTVAQQRLEVLLVGEPTGGAPNQYGDARRVKLPNHEDLWVRISTVYHELGGPDDERLTHEPDVLVELSSADYFADRDPVLEAALGFGA